MQRFDLESEKPFPFIPLHKHPMGHWVHYADVEPLLAENAKLRLQRRRLVEALEEFVANDCLCLAENADLLEDHETMKAAISALMDECEKQQSVVDAARPLCYPFAPGTGTAERARLVEEFATLDSMKGAHA